MSVLGIALLVLPEPFEPQDEVDLPPARPDHAHGEDDEGESRHQGYLAAFLGVCHGGLQSTIRGAIRELHSLFYSGRPARRVEPIYGRS